MHPTPSPGRGISPIRLPNCAPWLLAIGVLLPLPALEAQASPAPAGFAGRVIDVLGDPIVAAEVRAVRDGAFVARTFSDASGIYLLPAERGEGADLVVSARGKAPRRLRWHGRHTPRNRVVSLSDAVRVHGRVIGPEGDPCPGVAVVGLGEAEPVEGTSDAAGRFDLPGLPSGRVRVWLRHERWRCGRTLHLDGDFEVDLRVGDDPSIEREVAVANVPAELLGNVRVRIYDPMAGGDGFLERALAPPGTASLLLADGALVKIVAPGLDVQPPVIVIARDVRRLRFTARPAGAPVPWRRDGVLRTDARAADGLDVLLADGTQHVVATARTDADGAFAFELPDRAQLAALNRPTLGIAPGPWLPQQRGLRFDEGCWWVPITDLSKPIAIRVVASGLIATTVRGADGAVLALGEVNLRGREQQSVSMNTTTDIAGALWLHLVPGTYDLIATDATGRRLWAEAVVRSGATAEVKWRSLATGNVRGVLTDADGRPRGHVAIELDADSADQTDVPRAARVETLFLRTDGHGRFQFRGLLPGRWRMFQDRRGGDDRLLGDFEVRAGETATAAPRLP